MRARIRSYSLRGDAPIPGTVTLSHLRFEGLPLLEIEEVWNDADTAGTYLDGEILNRVAIYREYQKTWFGHWRPGAAYFAEEVRYNPRVCLIPPNRIKENPIPRFSRASGFSSFEEAIRWVRQGSLVSEGTIGKSFEAQIDGLAQTIRNGGTR